MTYSIWLFCEYLMDIFFILFLCIFILGSGWYDYYIVPKLRYKENLDLWYEERRIFQESVANYWVWPQIETKKCHLRFWDLLIISFVSTPDIFYKIIFLSSHMWLNLKLWVNTCFVYKQKGSLLFHKRKKNHIYNKL